MQSIHCIFMMISWRLSIAKNTNQLPSYTKTKGLDKERFAK